MRCLTDSWSLPGTSWMACGGTPAADAARSSTPTSAWLLCTAVALPRSRAALPLFKHSPAASTVTLGRAS